MSHGRVLLAGFDFYGYKRMMARALEGLGWQTDDLDVYYPNFDPALRARLLYSVLPARTTIDGFLTAAWRRSRREFMERLLKRDFELLLVTTPDFLTPDELAEIRARKPGALLACWIWDPIDRFPGFKPVMPLFDHVFIYDAADLENARNLNPNTHELLLAFDPELFAPSAESGAARRCKLSFIGSLSDERLRLLEAVLGGLGLGQDDVRIYGGAWRIWPLIGRYRLNRRSWLFASGLVRIETIGPQASAQLYHQSAVCLNLHQRGCRQGYNMRLFEIAGAGGFQMVERLEGIERVFRDGKEVVLYDSPADLVEKVRYYLTHPEEASAIARAGAKVAHQKHTFVHRMRAVLDACGMKAGAFGSDSLRGAVAPLD